MTAVSMCMNTSNIDCMLTSYNKKISPINISVILCVRVIFIRQIIFHLTNNRYLRENNQLCILLILP